jgi:hypothetical protein
VRHDNHHAGPSPLTTETDPLALLAEQPGATVLSDRSADWTATTPTP